MDKHILKLLAKAVKEKQCAAVRYRDQRQIRVIEPHCIYTNERDEMVVDGYQVRGYSSGGRPPPFWRPLRLKKITALSILKETFETRWAEGFDPNKKKYQKKIVAIVTKNKPNTIAYPTQQQQEMGPFLPDKR